MLAEYVESHLSMSFSFEFVAKKGLIIPFVREQISTAMARFNSIGETHEWWTRAPKMGGLPRAPSSYVSIYALDHYLRDVELEADPNDERTLLGLLAIGTLDSRIPYDSDFSRKLLQSNPRNAIWLVAATKHVLLYSGANCVPNLTVSLSASRESLPNLKGALEALLNSTSDEERSHIEDALRILDGREPSFLRP